MISLIAVMFLGMGLGYALRRRVWTEKLPHYISAVIFILLFLMGFSVGENQALLNQLAVLGGQAFAVSMAGTAGSLVFAWLIWKKWGRQK